MKLKVPFYKQTTDTNCGPVALRMVLAYFGDDLGIDILETRTEIKEGKGVVTIQIATAAALSGHRTDFYSKHVSFNEDNLKHEFYKKYTDLVHKSKKLIDDAQKAGVIIYERTLTLDKLLKNIGGSSIPIILLDWNVVSGKKEKGYQGHFVPIVGHDKENVYVHNHGFKNPEAFMPIKRKTFDEARKADGTDEDIIIIHKK